MPVELVVPFVIGVAAVFQATLNKQIAQHTGLAAATALNMAVAAGCAFVFAAWCAWRGQPDGLARWQPDFAAFRSWWLVPGSVGFAIVLLVPWSVQRVGALSTFVVLVSAQVLTSALWDRFVGGVPFTAPRVAGTACTIAGVVLLSRGNGP